MFSANMTVDVYREEGSGDYSEYDDSSTSHKLLVDRDVPIHITPFRPVFGTSSQRGGQTTKIIANTRRNHILKEGDELRSTHGRTFQVESVEPTDGAFMGNSVIYELIELNAVV